MSDLDWYIEHGNDYPPLTSGDLIALDMHVIAGRDEKESENQLRLIQSIAQDAYRRALEGAAAYAEAVDEDGDRPGLEATGVWDSAPDELTELLMRPDGLELLTRWLRDRAAGVGTKDGDDDPDAPPADRDDLAAILAKHKYDYPQLVNGLWHVVCVCGESIHVPAGDNDHAVFRAHVAQMVLESDWLRGELDKAWCNGYHAGDCGEPDNPYRADRVDAEDPDNTTDRT